MNLAESWESRVVSAGLSQHVAVSPLFQEISVCETLFEGKILCFFRCTRRWRAENSFLLTTKTRRQKRRKKKNKKKTRVWVWAFIGCGCGCGGVRKESKQTRWWWWWAKTKTKKQMGGGRKTVRNLSY